MTTNEPMEDIMIQLNIAAQKDVNIKIKPTIGPSIDFLDVKIANENGILRTTVHHKPSKDPYYLPYTSDHPHRIHRNIPYSALVRAARLCSNLRDFHFERMRIDLALLLNQYPPNFITNQFLRFFQVNKADKLAQEFHEQTYHILHKHLLCKKRTPDTKHTTTCNDPVLHPPVLQKN